MSGSQNGGGPTPENGKALQQGLKKKNTHKDRGRGSSPVRKVGKRAR